MGVMNLLEAAARMAAAAEGVKVAEHEIIEIACEMVEAKAKGLIGHPHSWWLPLAPETLKRKDGVNTPLLETGEMRDSIEHTVVDHEHGYVGSNNDKAVWHELGTSRVPPRSFLGAAAALEGPAVAKMAGEVMVAAVGGALAGGELGEVFHLLREFGHVAHQVKEQFDDLVSDDDKETR
jgi:hypothetical protein